MMPRPCSAMPRRARRHHLMPHLRALFRICYLSSRPLQLPVDRLTGTGHQAQPLSGSSVHPEACPFMFGKIVDAWSPKSSCRVRLHGRLIGLLHDMAWGVLFGKLGHGQCCPSMRRSCTPFRLTHRLRRHGERTSLGAHGIFLRSEMRKMRKIPLGDHARYQRCASLIMWIWLMHLEIEISGDSISCRRSCSYVLPLELICAALICVLCLLLFDNIPNKNKKHTI
jgi:hypothetical protein